MEASLRSGDNSITLVAPEQVRPEDSETQFAVFQTMLTFAPDLPCGQLRLVRPMRWGRSSRSFRQTADTFCLASCRTVQISHF